MDIIITPAVTIAGVLIASLVGPAIGAFMSATGEFIMYATTLRPF